MLIGNYNSRTGSLLRIAMKSTCLAALSKCLHVKQVDLHTWTWKGLTMYLMLAYHRAVSILWSMPTMILLAICLFVQTVAVAQWDLAIIQNITTHKMHDWYKGHMLITCQSQYILSSNSSHYKNVPRLCTSGRERKRLVQARKMRCSCLQHNTATTQTVIPTCIHQHI